MFEKELYEHEAARIRSEEGDLFHGYELKGWNPSPRLYKIVAISTIANILGLIVFAQGSFLTMRGCEAPFVGRVCSVLDTVYVGSVLFGTDREYADAVYEKTELEDAEITFVDVSGETPPLSYPEGYFQIANPERYAMQQDMAMNDGMPYPDSGFAPIPSPGNDLLNTVPEVPRSNPNPVKGNISDDLIKVEGDEDTKPDAGKGKKPDSETSENKTDSNSKTQADKAQVPENPQDEAKIDQFGVYINKRPLKDYAKDASEKIESSGVKLENPFKVVIAGTLGVGKDGKTIVLKNPKPVPSQSPQVNDPEMVKLAQDAILAVGDAGWFGYLDKLKAKNIVITVEQNDTILTASIRADQPTENDAKQAASGLNAILAIAVPASKGDEQTFLKMAKTTSDGKSFILNFEIPKPLVQEMIIRKLAESKDKENKPNGSAMINPEEKTAAK